MKRSSAVLLLGCLASCGLLLIYICHGRGNKPAGDPASPSIEEIGDSSEDMPTGIYARRSFATAQAMPQADPLAFRLPFSLIRRSTRPLPGRAGSSWLSHIFGKYEPAECVLTGRGSPNADHDYVFVQGRSVAAFFQAVTSKIIDILDHQIEECKQTQRLPADATVDFVSLYLEDVDGFEMAMQRYHGWASTKCKDILVTDAEYQEVISFSEDPGYCGPLKDDPAARWERYNKLIFSRNLHRLMCLIRDAQGKAELDEADFARIDPLVLLFHNIINELFDLEHADLNKHLPLASFLYPFNLHARTLDGATGRVSGLCCSQPCTDTLRYLTLQLNSAVHPLSLPQLHRYSRPIYFVEQSISEVVGPLIQLVAGVSQDRARAYTRQLQASQGCDGRANHLARADFYQLLDDVQNAGLPPRCNLLLLLVSNTVGHSRLKPSP